MELPRVAAAVPLAGLLVLALNFPSSARAAGLVTAAPAGSPVLVTSLHKRPAGYTLTAARVLALARADARVKAELRQHPRLLAYQYTHGSGTWQVSWFTPGKPQRELMQVYVDDHSSTVTQVWTGYQVAWGMARGYPGAFGRRLNALYVWLPLCLLFLAPFFSWRRKPGLLHLDLLMLLGFSISLAFFNHADIGLSVPLVYPFLIYLLGRMLLLAAGRGIPRRPLELMVPTHWLLAGAVFLIGLRLGLNILDSNVIDVGYAGVIGADKLIHGHLLYGLWPHDNAYGDTYGPVSYFAYLPFRLIFGWSGAWDSLPAAHAASITFDLLTTLGLYLLGRRVRGHKLGVVLMYAWVAYPFTLFALDSNTNDALVSALVVFALLAIDSPPGRGVLGALAGLTKFAPFALAPLLLRGAGRRPSERSVAVWMLAFGVTAFVAMLPVVLDGDLRFFWQHSVVYQANRVTPFSIWGLWGGLGGVQHLLQGAAGALAIGVAFVPASRGRGPVQVAALGAAILIALQLTVNYWLYPYIVWFFPLVAVALFASHPERQDRLSSDSVRPARAPVPEPPAALPVS
ncbi:MAG: hypothetical protein ACR2GZ_08795 [Solirubrobacteraceae bacterium]